jgi:hypothetical protein
MRANLFVYRDMKDPWLQELRARPEEMLRALMPGLRKLTGDFEVDDFVKIRPVDLYATRGHRQPGIVLVGDAFSTSCPAAGTGARKALNDIERLCNVYIPRWLATPGMDVDKIETFYDDPVKTACDDDSLAKAFALRSFSLDSGLRWRASRRLKFFGQYGVGTLRRLRQKVSPSNGERIIPAATGAGTLVAAAAAQGHTRAAEATLAPDAPYNAADRRPLPRSQSDLDSIVEPAD